MSEKNIVICDQEQICREINGKYYGAKRICGEGICMQHLGKCKDTSRDKKYSYHWS